MWETEEEEEPEIQVLRSSRVIGRPSSAQQHMRRELPVYEDSFTKRLGPRAYVTHESSLERSNASNSSSHQPRKNVEDEVKRLSREQEIVKVDKKCCSWPCNSDGVSALHHESDKQKTPRVSGSKRLSSSRSGKEPRGLAALLGRKFFRQGNNAVLYPAWEAELARWREQHDTDMKQMKEMYMGLQEICQDLKRLSTQRDDLSGTSSRRASLSESCDGKMDGAPLLGHSKKQGGLKFTQHPRENGHHLPNRRAKSAPKTRGIRDTGFGMENNLHLRIPQHKTWYCPTAAIFEEIVQVERLYLRNFVTSLVKYGEDRLLLEEFDEQKHESMTDLVFRLVPHATFAKASHYKYGIEAWLNRVVFKDFGKANYGIEEEKVHDARARRLSCWDEYQRLSFLSGVDAIDPDGKVYYQSFHVYCNRKFQAIHDELLWWDEWPDHLVEEFLEAMKQVWRAHKLALAFDPPASQFSIKTQTSFDIKFMDPLEVSTKSEDDDYSSQVGFIVNPGFIVMDRIIKSQVYLAPKDSLESDSSESIQVERKTRGKKVDKSQKHNSFRK